MASTSVVDWKEAMKRVFQRLVQDLKVETGGLLAYLVEKSVLNQETVQEIQAQGSDNNKAMRLLFLVERGPVDNYRHFAQGLKDTQQEFLARELEDSMQIIQMEEKAMAQASRYGSSGPEATRNDILGKLLEAVTYNVNANDEIKRESRKRLEEYEQTLLTRNAEVADLKQQLVLAVIFLCIELLSGCSSCN